MCVRVDSDDLTLKDFDESVLEFRNHVQNLPGKRGWEEKPRLAQNRSVTCSRIPFPSGSCRANGVESGFCCNNRSSSGCSGRKLLNGLQDCWEAEDTDSS